MSESIGKPLNRVDGRLKVTGGGRYAAEFPLENLAHAVVVQSTIARGRIQSIDTRSAEASPGMLAVITHLNAPKLATPQSAGGDSSGGDAKVLSPVSLVGKIHLRNLFPYCKTTKSISTDSTLALWWLKP